MRSNRKHFVEELEQSIHMYLDEGVRYQELKEEFGLLLNHSLFHQKALKYQAHGLKGIETGYIKNEMTNLSIKKPCTIKYHTWHKYFVYLPVYLTEGNSAAAVSFHSLFYILSAGCI